MKVTDLKQNEVIHCSTENEANELCKLMHESGLKWTTNKSYLKHNLWYNYKENTCYDPNLGTFSNLNYFNRKKYKIYPAKDFIRKLKINQILNENN